MTRILGFTLAFWAALVAGLALTLPLLLSDIPTAEDRVAVIAFLAAGIGIMGTIDLHRDDSGGGPPAPRNP